MKLRARRSGDDTLVFDCVRRKWVVLTPEEWVRRHVVGYLSGACSVELPSIVEEYPVELNGQLQRADVVVFGADSRPCLLVECKAPDVAIDDSVLAQAVRYNSRVRAPRLMLTNGLTTSIYGTCDFVRYVRMENLF